MFYTYILYSHKIERFYIGYSADPELRLETKHNKGYVKATKPGVPYLLMAKKSFDTEKEAIAEERRLKKKKSSKYLEWLIQGNW